MKQFLRHIAFLFLFVCVLPVYIVGCNGEPVETNVTEAAGLVETAQAEAVAAGVASTMAAVASQTVAAGEEPTTAVEVVATRVASTATQMATATQPAATATPVATDAPATGVPVDIEAVQTSVAATVIAELAVTPVTLLQMQVKEDSAVHAVNIRRGPNICFGVAAILERGRLVTVLGRHDMRSWYQVALDNGVVGWVWADYVELVEPGLADQVPLLSAIPNCLTPTPTAAGAQPVATPCAYPPCLAPLTEPTSTAGDPYSYP